MVRASLPAAGVAAALLLTSVAFGQTQTPLFSADPPVLYLSPAWPEPAWQPQSEVSHPLLDLMGENQLLDQMGENQLVSFEVADEEKPRLKPAPQQTKEPAVSCPDAPAVSCPSEIVEEICDGPAITCVPVFLPPPQQQCFGHKCHRRNKGCHGCSNQGGYGPGYGCAYQGGYGMGYGCPYAGGGYSGWGCGMDGCFGGFCPPPYLPQGGCSCHKCKHKHGGSCPRCGYPGYGGYGYGPGTPGGWSYPVGGWSVMDDGYNGFADPNCFGGKQGCCHGGLFHRCHKQQQCQPPYPYWPAPQPCCGMSGGCSPF